MFFLVPALIPSALLFVISRGIHRIKIMGKISLQHFVQMGTTNSELTPFLILSCRFSINISVNISEFKLPLISGKWMLCSSICWVHVRLPCMQNAFNWRSNRGGKYSVSLTFLEVTFFITIKCVWGGEKIVQIHLSKWSGDQLNYVVKWNYRSLLRAI